MIHGYEITEEIHVGVETLILRGTRLSDGKKVIIKTSQEQFQSSAFKSRLKEEFRLLTLVDRLLIPCLPF